MEAGQRVEGEGRGMVGQRSSILLLFLLLDIENPGGRGEELVGRWFVVERFLERVENWRVQVRLVEGEGRGSWRRVGEKGGRAERVGDEEQPQRAVPVAAEDERGVELREDELDGHVARQVEAVRISQGDRDADLEAGDHGRRRLVQVEEQRFRGGVRRLLAQVRRKRVEEERGRPEERKREAWRRGAGTVGQSGGPRTTHLRVEEGQRQRNHRPAREPVGGAQTDRLLVVQRERGRGELVLLNFLLHTNCMMRLYR